jgi:hypothetical protein
VGHLEDVDETGSDKAIPFRRKPEHVLRGSGARDIAQTVGSAHSFAYARTALKYGLKEFGLGCGDEIPVPGFICESAL